MLLIHIIELFIRELNNAGKKMLIGDSCKNNNAAYLPRPKVAPVVTSILCNVTIANDIAWGVDTHTVG